MARKLSTSLRRSLLLGTSALGLQFMVSTELFAQAAGTAPTAAAALRLMPTQKADVEIDMPTAAEAENCKIEARPDRSGWIVRAANGQILREFVDTNKNQVVDRWCYYKDGVEVYRDIDENHDGRAEQMRWMNTAGIRWGLDTNQDGTIDSWKMISPEEVTAEVVAAMRTRDAARFQRVLMSETELSGLGLGEERAAALKTKLGKAQATFASLLKTQQLVTDKTTWGGFGGTRPGVVPAGTAGSTSDLVAYENVVTMLDGSASKSGQLQIGTLVKVGDLWRVIDAPHTDGQNLAGGFFFDNQQRQLGGNEGGFAGGLPSAELQKLLDEAQKLDTALEQTSAPAEQARLSALRADKLQEIVDQVEPKEKAVWNKQLADAVAAGVQTGQYPNGLSRLKALAEKLAANKDDVDTAAFVTYRAMQAEYAASMQGTSVDYVKLQAAWLEKLEKFVTDYPTSPDSAEALLQLGSSEEFAGQDAKAKAWYQKIVTSFPQSTLAKKARGAITRLDSVGQVMQLTGKAIGTTTPVNLTAYRGRVVLIHYWATWCEPAKVDMAQLKELHSKYNRAGFELIGVNLDEQAATATDYLTKNRLPWAQLHEPGGLDSRLAQELGIMNLPTMILVDENGKVAHRGIHITELESDLQKRLRGKEPPAAAQVAPAPVPTPPAPQTTNAKGFNGKK
jgi:thiol-disulfide isomerase/thioredoxin